MQVRFIGIFVVAFVINGSFSTFGQELIDESNNFKEALEHSSWTNKPQSYKKTLLTVILNAQQTLHIRPAGLYILNTEHTQSILNAVYSYLNLMRNAKRA